jgi:hypothetical protein
MPSRGAVVARPGRQVRDGPTKEEVEKARKLAERIEQERASSSARQQQAGQQ